MNRKSGIIGFVTNAGWVDGRAADGLRKCLAAEFSSIHVFHLRGNQRTSGDLSRKEGGKIFGSGSRAPIAISLLVKNPKGAAHGRIYFHDIGDYLTTEQKLLRIAEFGSVQGIAATEAWRAIMPDEQGDWLKQRDASFEKFMVMGDKKTDQQTIFESYSSGVKTQRDAWCLNFSRTGLLANLQSTTEFFNAELQRFDLAHPSLARADRERAAETFLNSDPTRISWSDSLRTRIVRSDPLPMELREPVQSLYRPFTKSWLYFDRTLIERVYQMPRLFPGQGHSNLAIAVAAPGSQSGFSVLLTETPAELCVAAMKGSQYFPLYLYEKASDDEDTEEGSLFARSPSAAKEADSYTRRDGISDAGLAHFQAAYPLKGEGDTITKEALFYYIYGLLHSPDYRSRYADNLGKELPRIPAVKRFADFQAFSQAGRDLAHWHLNYETVECYKGVKIEGDAGTPARKGGTELRAGVPASLYRVEKMKFAKTRDPETNKSINDKTTVLYNAHITLRDIPEAAYDYVVNGKPALEWVMERQSISKDKDSGIINDANLWATETMGNPKYPLELFLRVITVSLETLKIVNGLPKLEMD